MTAAELRAIVERDRADRERLARQLAPVEPSPRDAELEAELGPLPSIAEVVRPSRAEEDRGALLDLLRAVAKVEPVVEMEGRDLCVFCGEEQPGHYITPGEPRDMSGRRHGPACPAPALEALRPPA